MVKLTTWFLSLIQRLRKQIADYARFGGWYVAAPTKGNAQVFVQ